MKIFLNKRKLGGGRRDRSWRILVAALSIAGLSNFSKARAGNTSAMDIVEINSGISNEKSLINRKESRAKVGFDAEIGAITPLFHVVQFSKSGSRIDYVKDAGQDNLYFYSRWAAQLKIDDRHSMRLLYQPLDLRTTERPDRALRVDGSVFPANRPIEFRYGFSFFRASYLYDLLKDPRAEVSIGLAGQIRNATIEFKATDGSLVESQRDIGFVPLIAFRGEYLFAKRLWVGGEATGFYAPIKYINGGRSDVEGAIADVATRVGLRHKHGMRTALTLRYIGGGATGTEKSPREPADGYVKNWLHTFIVSIGIQLR